MFAVSGWLILARPWESPAERADRLCGECGLTDDRTDQLIEDVRLSGASRETAVRLWEATYADPAILEQARDLCGGCVKAVVDVTRQETPRQEP
jgi:hypothetical protein